METLDGQSLSPEILVEKREEIQVLEQPEQRAQAWTDLASQLLPSRTEIWRDVHSTTQSISYAEGRLEAATALIQYLPPAQCTLLPDLLNEARDATEKIAFPTYKIKGLTKLASYLSDCEQSTILKQAIEILPQVENEDTQADALRGIAPHLIPSSSKLLEQALDIACQIKKESALCTALEVLAPQLTSSELLKQALDKTCEIQEPWYQSRVFIALAPNLSFSHLLNQALEAAKHVRELEHRVKALTALAPQLASNPQQHLEIIKQILEAIPEVDSAYSPGGVLVTLVSQIPPYGTYLIEQALQIAQQLGQGWVLASLISEIPSSQFHLLMQAWEIASQFNGKEYQSQDERLGIRISILLNLIPKLPHQQLDLLQEALYLARQIEDLFSRAEVFAELASQIDDQQQRIEILHDALSTANLIQDSNQNLDNSRRRVLEIIAPHLSLFPGLFSQAIEVAEKSKTFDAIRIIAPYLSSAEPKLVLKALNSITAQHYQDEALIALAPHLSPTEPQIIQQTLDIISQLRSESDRCKTLVAIAPHLSLSQPDLIKKALEIAGCLQQDVERVQALASLISQLPNLDYSGIFQHALDAIKEISDSKSQSEALVDLVRYISSAQTDLIQQAQEIAEQIQPLEYKVLALVSLVSKLPLPKREIVLKQALEEIKFAQSSEQKGRATYLTQALSLEAVASQLSPSDSKFLQQALDKVEQIKNKELLCSALAQLAPKLPHTHLQQALRMIEQLGSEMFKSEARAITFEKLAQQLLESQTELIEKVFNLTQANIKEKYCPKVFSALIPKLSDSQCLESSKLVSEFRLEQYRKDEFLCRIAKKLSSQPQQALDVVRKIGGKYELANALQALFPYIFSSSTESVQQALNLSRKILSSSDLPADKRVDFISQLFSQTSFLDIDLFQEALVVASKIEWEDNRVQALIQLAISLPESMLHESLKLVFELREESLQVNVIKKLITSSAETLAVTLPEHKLPIVLRAIATQEEDADRVRFLSALAPRLSTGLFSSALRLVKKEVTKDSSYQAELLSNLATYLLEEQFLEALNLAEKEIEDEFFQSEVLENLIPYLTLIQLSKALQVAQDIEGQVARSKVLVAISRKLNSLLNEVSQSFQEPVNPSAVSLSEEVLQAELSRIEKIEPIDTRVKASIALANYITGSQKTKILSFALETVSGIQYEAYRAEALSAIAAQLSSNEDELALQALSLAQQIQDKYFKVATLVNLVPKLPEPQRADVLQSCLDVAQQIQAPYAQATVLAEVAPYLSDHLCVEQFQQAINIAEQIEYEAERVEAFTIITSRLSFDHPNLLQQVLEITQKFEAGEYRDRITQAFGDNLSIALIQQILKILQNNTEEKCEKYSSDILCALSPHFLEIQLPDVFKTIETFQDEGYQAQALQALAFQLSNNPGSLLISNQKQLDKIWKIVANFQKDYFKVKVYSASSTTIGQAEFIASNLYKEFKFLGTEAFLEIAINLASVPALNKALEAIRDESLNNHAYLRANYLNRLDPYFRSSQQRLEAQLIAQNIEEDYYRVQSLSVLANYFPELRQQAEEAAKQVSNLVHRIELLSALAIETPTILPDLIKLLRKESENDEITNSINRKRVLVALQPHLPARIVREIDRERRSGRRIPEELWNRALKQLARSYREALKAGGLRNDEAQAQDLLNLRDEVNSMADFLLLRDLEPPMVVGVLGNWGGGKSYILHLMQAHMVEIRSRGVDEEEAWNLNPGNDRLSPYIGHIYQIKFDAWSFSKSNLWASLMQTIFFELERQIKLEVELEALFRENNFNPYEEAFAAAQIWQVLYKTNESERTYFLEKVLPQQLKELVDDLREIGKQNSLDEVDRLLWNNRDIIQAQAREKLHSQELNLVETQNKLSQYQQELEEAEKKLVKNQRNLESFTEVPKSQLQEALSITSGATLRMLRKYLGKPALNKFQQDLVEELPKDVNLEELEQFRQEVEKTFLGIFEDIEEVSLKQWFTKYLPQIIIFCLLITASLTLPSIIPKALPWLKSTSFIVAGQIAALVVPLLPALRQGSRLWRSAKQWHMQATEAVNAYKAEAVENSNRLESRLKKQEQELRKTVEEQNKEVEALRATQKELEDRVKDCYESVKVAKQDLPDSLYGSLQDYIAARIQDGVYDQHLGLMHQVKEDLINLSRRLLAPPITSAEYSRKIEDLKAIFPRGPARVVVYIDDLDRCPPDRVVEVLEAIQLLVKTPLFIAVLAIDERYIIRALEKHYAGVLSRRGRPSGEDYLEKIIQIPYRVRPISASALENYLRSQVVIQDTATGGTKFSEVSRDEFSLLLDCCRYVDLSPRTIKRLTNVYKVFKVVCRTRGTKPSRKVQQAIIALLVLSGRHTNLMREVFADMEAHYEGKGSGEQETIWKLVNNFYESNRSLIGDSYSQREFDRFKQDALTTQLIPRDLTLALLTYDLFNLVRSFSFVGDVGYATEDFRSVARTESVDQ